MPDTADALVSHAESAWGSAARPPQWEDAVDGLVPTLVLQPSSVTMLAEMLRWADRDRRVVLPRGGGTKIGWGPRLRKLDAILSLSDLPRHVEHAAGDLVGIFPAGATLGAVNDALARERQWLPIDPLSGPGSTIGGIVATNETGPRRLGYGSPRDLVIGAELVLADGTTAKSGGRVVKNVSGYDLARMLCGSYGTLAVITSATFKLSPRPQASSTIVARVASTADLDRLTACLGALPSVPSAVDFDGPPWRLLVRIESTRAATGQHARDIVTFFGVHDLAAEQLSGLDEERTWQACADGVRAGGGALLKVSVPPSSLADVLETCQQLAERNGLVIRTSGRATLGVFALRLTAPHGEDDASRIASLIAPLRLRAKRDAGFAVLLEAPLAVKDRVAAWDDPGPAGPLMQAVKRAFDPNGTLNPDRSFA